MSRQRRFLGVLLVALQTRFVAAHSRIKLVVDPLSVLFWFCLQLEWCVG
jgi:hypothetical protein